MILQILPQIPDNENVGIVSILIAVIAVLVSALVYMHKDYKKDLRIKEQKIDEIIKNHQQDLKEGNDDYKEMIDKYHALFERIKDWHYESKRGNR